MSETPHQREMRTNREVLDLILAETNKTIEDADEQGGTPFEMLQRMILERNQLREDVKVFAVASNPTRPSCDEVCEAVQKSCKRCGGTGRCASLSAPLGSVACVCTEYLSPIRNIYATNDQLGRHAAITQEQTIQHPALQRLESAATACDTLAPNVAPMIRTAIEELVEVADSHYSLLSLAVLIRDLNEADCSKPEPCLHCMAERIIARVKVAD